MAPTTIGASAFNVDHLLHLATLSVDNHYVTFTGPLPVGTDMNVEFASSPARMHASPIAQLPLPMRVRSGRYAGELQLPGLREPSVLTWDADGNLELSLTQWSGCGATGKADVLLGAP